jgi:hypothetical protein
MSQEITPQIVANLRVMRSNSHYRQYDDGGRGGRGGRDEVEYLRVSENLERAANEEYQEKLTISGRKLPQGGEQGTRHSEIDGSRPPAEDQEKARRDF